ncbi:hypothetical protein [Xylanimonas allomyrinae]|nr:hypothetical protein [Xylanimonas allomyrinae]
MTDTTTEVVAVATPDTHNNTKRNAIIAAIVVAVLALGAVGTIAYNKIHTQHKIDAVAASVVDVANQTRATQKTIRADLDTAKKTEATVEHSIADTVKAADLAFEIEKSTKALDIVIVPVEDGSTLEEAQAILADAKKTLADINSRDTKLKAANEAALASHQQLLLDNATTASDAAKTALDSVIASATQTLAGTDGQVADNATRQGLQAAIDTANALSGAAVDGTSVDALTKAAADFAATQQALEGAVATVNDSVEAKKTADAEAARIAAEQKAAAQNKAQSSSSSTGSSNGSSSSSGGSSKGSSRSSSVKPSEPNTPKTTPKITPPPHNGYDDGVDGCGMECVRM